MKNIISFILVIGHNPQMFQQFLSDLIGVKNFLRWNHLVIMAMCFLLGFGLFPESASAAKRIGFVVGIDIYDNLGENDQLKSPVNDAKAISKILTNIGFEVTEGFNLTIDEFDEKWQKVLKNTKAKDTLLFYFSGHGVEVDGENFLLPRNVPFFEFGRDKRFKRKSISVSDILDDLRFGDRETPEVTIMVLDACRDNPTIPSQYKKGFGSKGGLIEIPKVRGKFLMYAAAPGQVALDRLGSDDKHPNSVYTRTLLPLLRQTNLSIQDLAIKTREQVYALTQRVAYEQIPEYTDGLIGRFCIAGCQILDQVGAAKQFADQEAMRREAEGHLQKEIGKLKSENKELRNIHETKQEEELEYDSIYRIPSDGTPIYLSLAFQDATSFRRGEIWLDKEKIGDITNLKNGQWEYTALKQFYPIAGKILRVVTWSNQIAELSTIALEVYPSTYYRFYPSGKESKKRFLLQSKEPTYLKSGKFEVNIFLKS